MKFCDIIGFSSTTETKKGVWTESIVEKTYYGDITRSTKRWESSENLNDNLVIGNEFSIILDSYAYTNSAHIKYIKFGGAKWKVNKIEIKFPRMHISTGGLYNG